MEAWGSFRERGFQKAEYRDEVIARRDLCQVGESFLSSHPRNFFIKADSSPSPKGTEVCTVSVLRSKPCIILDEKKIILILVPFLYYISSRLPGKPN